MIEKGIKDTKALIINQNLNFIHQETKVFKSTEYKFNKSWLTK